MLTLSADASDLLAGGANGRLDEYRVKAALLVNFTKFVQWPHEAPLTLCVVGEAPGLDPALAAHTKDGSIVPRRVDVHDDMSRCDVLFVSAGVGRNTGELLTRLSSAAVLTIGETDPFLNDGGLVRFFLEGNRIRFQINAKASEEHGLKISSQLLSLAAH
jgi:hypothetical protein